MKKLIRQILPFIVIAVLLVTSAAAYAVDRYVVKSGDSLYEIGLKFNMTTAQLAVYNSLGTTGLSVGQKLILVPNIKHKVRSVDTLWLIARNYGTTVARLKSINGLSSDMILVGQILTIPLKTPTPVPHYPSIKYKVQSGDTGMSIAKKFGTTASEIMKYNYMSIDDWFDAEETIAINGYAPRYYSTVPNITTEPYRVGRLVDWFHDGQYLLKRNDTFRIIDVATGSHFNVKMIGGIHHSDVEPLTTTDTAVVKTLFPTYKWEPRAVVIYKEGMNIAASFSGMPHSFDTIGTNGVTGHFDVYLYNSKGHSGTVSQIYMDQHKANVFISAGLD